MLLYKIEPLKNIKTSLMIVEKEVLYSVTIPIEHQLRKGELDL